MVNSLCVVSNGYLNPFTIKALEVSVDGYLIETVTPVKPSGGGGGEDIEVAKPRQELIYKKWRVEVNNDILFAVIQVFLKSKN
jgi:hypothetical protein